MLQYTPSLYQTRGGLAICAFWKSPERTSNPTAGGQFVSFSKKCASITAMHNMHNRSVISYHCHYKTRNICLFSIDIYLFLILFSIGKMSKKAVTMAANSRNSLPHLTSSLQPWKWPVLIDRVIHALIKHEVIQGEFNKCWQLYAAVLWLPQNKRKLGIVL